MILSGSFSSEVAIRKNGFSLFPQDFTIEAYETVFKEPLTVIRAYITTIGLTIVGTALGLLLQTMTAYVLSRKDFGWRNAFSFFFYFTTLFSGGLVPYYILINRKARAAQTILLRLLGDPEGAILTARQTLAFDPIDFAALRELSLADLLESALRGDAHNYIALAQTYAELGQYTDAIAILESYLAKTKDTHPLCHEFLLPCFLFTGVRQSESRGCLADSRKSRWRLLFPKLLG